jgi:hypothetical protein
LAAQSHNPVENNKHQKSVIIPRLIIHPY